MKAFILCAGQGTRLGPLTNDLPKVMCDIGGKPVIEHLVLLCRRHGITDVIINLHHLPDAITAYFGSGARWDVNITYSRETVLMGGAGALKLAQQELGDKPFFVLNGDVLADTDLTAMLAFHKSKNAAVTLLKHATDHPRDSDLIESDEDGRVIRFYRLAPQDPDPNVPFSNAGVHILEPDVLKFVPEHKPYSLERELIPELLRRGQACYAWTSDCYAADMGTPERLAHVRKDYADGRIRI